MIAASVAVCWALQNGSLILLSLHGRLAITILRRRPLGARLPESTPEWRRDNSEVWSILQSPAVSNGRCDQLDDHMVLQRSILFSEFRYESHVLCHLHITSNNQSQVGGGGSYGSGNIYTTWPQWPLKSNLSRNLHYLAIHLHIAFKGHFGSFWGKGSLRIALEVTSDIGIELNDLWCYPSLASNCLPWGNWQKANNDWQTCMLCRR